MKKILKSESPYDFRAVLFSHGWYDLPPFYAHENKNSVDIGLRSGGKSLSVRVSAALNGIEVETKKWSKDLETSLRWMFKLDEPLDEFYKAAHAHGRSWIEEKKMGRLLRSQTIFEDVTKLVLTTNCSWAFTKIMATRLAEKLGERTDEGLLLFPTPQVMAKKNEKFYRETIRAGYRSPNLVKLSNIFAKGLIDPKRWIDPSVSFQEARKEILSLPGAGPYVADNLLRYLGRYERLGLDSWARQKLKTEWKMKKNPSDKTIERKYKPFGNFRGLILWCDLTRDWL